MAINDVYSVLAIQRLHGQACINTFYYQQTNNGDDEAGLLTRFDATVGAAVRSAQSDEVTWEAAISNRILPLPRRAQVVATLSSQGAIIEPSLPTSVAVLVSKKTHLAGARYRGRWYFAGAAKTDADESTLNAGGVAAWNAVPGPLLQTLTTIGGVDFVPVHYHQSEANPGTYATTVVTSTLLRSILRNQRRRQVGVGI